MQFEKAQAIYKATPEEVRRNCVHSWDKEYYLGAQTGDKRCSKCGETKVD